MPDHDFPQYEPEHIAFGDQKDRLSDFSNEQLLMDSRQQDPAGTSNEDRHVRLRGPAPSPTVSWVVIALSFLGILVLMRYEPIGPSAVSPPNDSAARLRARVSPPSVLELRFLEMFSKVAIAGGLLQSDPNYVEGQANQIGVRLQTPEAQLRLGILELWRSGSRNEPNRRALQHFARATELWRIREWGAEWAEPMWKGGITYRVPRTDDQSFQFVSDTHELPAGISSSPTGDEADELSDDTSSPGPSKGDFDQIRLTLMQLAAFGDVPDDTGKKLLRDRLGWFGDLAVSTHSNQVDPVLRGAMNDANHLLMLMGFLGAGAFLLVLTGFGCFVFAIVLRLTGRIRLRLAPERLFTDQSAAVFLEAFAVYFVCIALLSFTLHATGLAGSVLGIAPIILGSVLGLIWPYVRGLPRSRASFEIGFSSGQGFFREVLCGIFGYLAGVPVYLFGILLTIVFIVIWGAIQFARGEASEPQPFSHPAIEGIASGNTTIILAFFFLAVVFAPFFEEVMFRGSFYGALRRRLPIFPSALLMSFVFAAIHPQGFLAVPALMGLAFVFGLMREWRGSLIAPMVAHALHNGMLVTASVLILSGS